MYRGAAARQLRLFSTSRVLRQQQKGPVEGAKDAVKTVDKTISQGIVKGIEKGGTLSSIFLLTAIYEGSTNCPSL